MTTCFGLAFSMVNFRTYLLPSLYVHCSCPALASNIMKVELLNLTALAQNAQLRPHLFDVAVPDYFSHSWS